MYAKETWVLVSLGAQVQPQIILDPDYPPDYPSISYDYGSTNEIAKIGIIRSRRWFQKLIFFFRFGYLFSFYRKNCF